MTFKATILTIFPEMFPATLQYSIAGQALKAGIWNYEIIDIRDFGLTRHKNVDDVPYGGGNGMVMRADVLGEAIDKAQLLNPNAQIIYMSPRGAKLNQKTISNITTNESIIIICGRFEGIDERILEEYNIQEISIGDYILSGGELAALTLLDACIRLLPGVLSNNETLKEESFETFNDLNKPMLEYPLYTRPQKWRNRTVPQILTSGNHKKIQEWREAQALEITIKRRPDLLN